MYITRASESLLNKMIKMFKVVLVTGPRQVGKTTMLQHILGNDYSYITLDDINELEIAKTDPKLFFLNNPGKVVIDEVQYAPQLFPEIKRLVDASDERGSIVLTGSQTFSLMDGISESLAGRIGILELNGLSLREIKGEDFFTPVIPTSDYLGANRKSLSNSDLWRIIHRGSMPELHRYDDTDWQLFYSSYIKTYIERDVRQTINVKDLSLFSRFMLALAARTGQLVNYSALANELGVDSKTVKEWISILEASGIIVTIRPFSNNRLKRAIKTPMLYFMDTGLVSYLLKWPTAETLMNGAMSGPILETFVVSEIIKSFQNVGFVDVPIYFYRDKDMNEIDVIVEDSGILYPIEIKKSATPSKRMAKHLSILDKAVGYTTGTRLIMCLVDKPLYLEDDLVAYPVSQI